MLSPRCISHPCWALPFPGRPPALAPASGWRTCQSGVAGTPLEGRMRADAGGGPLGPAREFRSSWIRRVPRTVYRRGSIPPAHMWGFNIKGVPNPFIHVQQLDWFVSLMGTSWIRACHVLFEEIDIYYDGPGKNASRTGRSFCCPFLLWRQQEFVDWGWVWMIR